MPKSLGKQAARVKPLTNKCKKVLKYFRLSRLDDLLL